MARERPAAPTLAQAIEEYLDWQALDRGRSPNTVRAYGIDLAGFRAFAGAAGIDELAGVDRDLLREFQAAMARGRRGAKPLSLQTRHRRLVALGSFLRFCAREEWFVVGLDARGTTSLDDLEVADQPLLVVVRSEGSGLSRLVGETCDLTVAIPMAGPAESLNASVAAAVTLAEIARLRRAS